MRFTHFKLTNLKHKVIFTDPCPGPITRLVTAGILFWLLSCNLFIFYGKCLPKLQEKFDGENGNWGNILSLTGGKIQCKKKLKIVYLKTHKCASSSLQNIFLRFGEKNNLQFVLPRGGYQFGGE